MKKIFTLLVLLCLNLISGQNYIIKYQFYQDDKVYDYDLMITEDYSLFYQTNLINFDNDDIQIDQSCERFYYYYDKVKLDYAIYDFVEKIPLQVSYNIDLKWTLEQSKPEDYLSYKVQTANLIHNGTTWNTIYTNDIPINDGPFIFKNLPGLVLEVSNEKGDKFKLVEIKEVDKKNDCISNGKFKTYDFKRYKSLVESKEEIGNALFDSLIKIEGLKVNKSAIQKPNFEPMRFLL